MTAYTWEKVNVGQNECIPTYFWNGHFERCVLYGVPQALSISHVSSQKSKVSTHSCEFWESWQRPWYSLGTKGKLRSSLGEQIRLTFILSGNRKKLSDEGIADSEQMCSLQRAAGRHFPQHLPTLSPHLPLCDVGFWTYCFQMHPSYSITTFLWQRGLGKGSCASLHHWAASPTLLDIFEIDAVAKASHELALCCLSFQVDEIADTHHQVWLQRSLSYSSCPDCSSSNYLSS